MYLFFLIFFLLLLISAIFFTIFEINFVKNFLKIENDKKIIELAYTAIKDIKFNKKGNKISKCYKLIIKTNSKDLKFFVRTKENYFGGATENDFDNLENFYFFLKEKIEK